MSRRAGSGRAGFRWAGAMVVKPGRLRPRAEDRVWLGARRSLLGPGVVASAVSTETGAMLGFARVLALLFFCLFLCPVSRCFGSHGLRWRLSGLLEHLQVLGATSGRLIGAWC